MREKIQEAQDYFRNKIVNGEYVIMSTHQYRSYITIDDRYHLEIWMTNGVESFCIDFLGRNIPFTDEERKVIYTGLESRINKAKLDDLLEQKKEIDNEINELQKDANS